MVVSDPEGVKLRSQAKAFFLGHPRVLSKLDFSSLTVTSDHLRDSHGVHHSTLGT
jgi:hypothetical protein